MTPMMEQYFEIKNQYKDHIVFYRLGDFYEMFFDDAILASRELELTLTGRDCGEEERAPMCGVPFHSAEGYIGTLVSRGYKVAICEQTENPALAKGLVRREVIRVVTPGTLIESDLLSEGKSNYLCSVYMSQFECGVAFADVSTAKVFATFFCGDDVATKLRNELGTYAPAEVVLNLYESKLGDLADFIHSGLGALLNDNRASQFDYDESLERVKKQFGDSVKDEHLENRPLVSALGALLSYVEETQKKDISYIKDLSIYQEGQYLEMDINTRRNLELTATMRSKEKKGSLLGVLDKTVTAAGARLLCTWVEHPLLNVAAIRRRQNAVEELSGAYILREELRELLSNVLDLERLVTRVVYGTANARDLRAVANTVGVLPELKTLLGACRSDELVALTSELETLEDVYTKINSAICENPPVSIREGGIIAEGFNSDVDYLRSVMTDGKSWISRVAEEERTRTGIKTLKIGY
ncbi:MAG: DNA mismatch repair protein MutS, partial [Clostridia bacterium]|nr:DNA mismatch repair protein MutS [Clostridia bacterium]